MRYMKYLIDLAKDWLLMTWHGFGSITWIALIVIAVVASNPWIYHPLFLLAFIYPCVYFIRYAFLKRSNDYSNPQRTLDNIGTLLTLLVASFFLSAYIGCLYLKMS